ncbi:hypothetical protein R6Q59_025064 [Mikania micrantha]
MHTAGPKSFARICDEMINDDPNKELPTLTKMFEHTRKRTEGRAYVDTYDDTQRKIHYCRATWYISPDFQLLLTYAKSNGGSDMRNNKG